ncbi:uncharacterized protein LOC101454087 [Ceratitis capitata]|uniref:(Mediterranean fruit fly) hypothetical protein n=1 Tax=Ceratitis capitata TaxID=7213 RepID=W8BPV8_CERCA|nr:uncharacterized protein LOC101454087 [Ceratitis capitata]CAD7011653.1 unnamed protein product [Ceratitis capitata]
MSAKLKCPKTTNHHPTSQVASKYQKTQSSTNFGAFTTRSINSISSSVSSCSSRRSYDNNSKASKSCCTSTSNKRSNATSGDKRFSTTAGVNERTSLFRSFITTGPRVRRSLAQSNDFAYDLSKDESRFMGNFKGPMKTVPANEREMLKNGQRGAYLAVRYEHSPDRKYNYPEATSWRIGWLHNQMARRGVSI